MAEFNANMAGHGKTKSNISNGHTLTLLRQSKNIMMMVVFWVVAPRSLVEVYRRFRGPCCLHHQGDRPETTQKTAIFVLTAVRTSNPTYQYHDSTYVLLLKSK
jgi:hypothetical protein